MRSIGNMLTSSRIETIKGSVFQKVAIFYCGNLLNIGDLRAVAKNMQRTKTEDGRMRYQEELRERGYRHLIQTAKRICPDLEIGLCLETHEMLETFSQQVAMGQCNCVL